MSRTVAWILIILACLVLQPRANGAEIGLGAGVAAAQRPPDGFWYQQALPYSWRRDTVAWRLSAGVGTSVHTSLTLAYVNEGIQRLTAVATTDANYDKDHHRCLSDPCRPTDLNVEWGSYNGFTLTEEVHTLGRTRFGAGVGAYLWKQDWRWDGSPIDDRGGLPPGVTHRSSHGSYHLAPTVALSTRYGRHELRADYLVLCFLNRCLSESYMPTPWRSAVVLTYNVHFGE